jgi:hypothetical protein
VLYPPQPLQRALRLGVWMAAVWKMTLFYDLCVRQPSLFWLILLPGRSQVERNLYKKMLAIKLGILSRIIPQVNLTSVDILFGIKDSFLLIFNLIQKF